MSINKIRITLFYGEFYQTNQWVNIQEVNQERINKDMDTKITKGYKPDDVNQSYKEERGKECTALLAQPHFVIKITIFIIYYFINISSLFVWKNFDWEEMFWLSKWKFRSRHNVYNMAFFPVGGQN